jgi:hypothetical protein
MLLRLIRHVRIAMTLAITVGSIGTSSALAMPAPEPGVWYACQTKAAGYSPMAAGSASGWTWDGRLQWEICVAETSSGMHYAIARLSSPADLIGPYDRYTGVSYVYLQKCVNGTYTTVGEKYWGVAQYSTATKVGSRYQFTWLQTSSTTSSATSYRVHIVTVSGAVVPRNGGFIFSLEPDGFYPYPGNEGIYNTSCVNP